jgi:quercetin dioxygenase-like cupin family protein
MKKHLVWILVLACAVAVGQTAQKPAGEKKAATPAAKKPESKAVMEPDHKAWAPGELEWGPAPDVLPAGAKLAVLEGDPTKRGEFTMRLKMPDGYRIPPHFHPRMEHVTLISGSAYVGMGDKFDESKMSGMSVGTFAWIKPGAHHFAMAKGETVIQLHGNGPWELNYVNSQDDPRKSTQRGSGCR